MGTCRKGARAQRNRARVFFLVPLCLGGVLLLGVPCPGGTSIPLTRRTFVPQWRLGDEWDVAEEQEAKLPDGRSALRTNRYTFRVVAMAAAAPGRREVHIEGRGDDAPAWDRAHLIFTWMLPSRTAATDERLWLSRLAVRTRDEPPRMIVLDFDAVSAAPHPVLAYGAPLPLDFPVFSVHALTRTKTEEFRPEKRPGAPREPPHVRQVLTDAPRLPPGALGVPMDRRQPIEFRLEPMNDPLLSVTQIWDAAYPWAVYERTPAQRLTLAAVRVKQGDPMALVERAAGLADRLGTPGESAALWSFRELLSESARAGLETPGGLAAAPSLVARHTTEFLGTFAVRGLTATFARMVGADQALVEIGGLTSGGDLERRIAVCVLEKGHWKIGSGAQPAVQTRPAGPTPDSAPPTPTMNTGPTP
jgi:hypothetical protein